MRKYLTICISMMLILGTFTLASGGLESNQEKDIDQDEDIEFRHKDTQDKNSQKEEVIGKNAQDKISSRSKDDLIEVMIRLTPHSFEDQTMIENPISKVNTGQATAKLKDHTERKQSEVIDFLNRGNGEVINTFWIANAILAEVEVRALDELRDFEQIWKVHENFEINIQGVENLDSTDPQIEEKAEMFERPYEFDDEITQEIQKIDFDTTDSSSNDVTWGLDRINVTEVWDQGPDGSGVRVAVSDTGVDMNHPDLEGKMVTVDENNPHYPGGWIEFDRNGEIVEDSTPHDTHGHGTHTLGTVLGGNESGTHIGVAPGAKLMHALAMPDGGGSLGQLLAGMEWKVEPHDRKGVPLHEKYGGQVEDYRAHIASMSWGVEGYFPGFEEPIMNMMNAGVVPVVSIGNSGEGTVGSPGAIYEAFGIGASNKYDDIANFSSGAIVEDDRADTPDEYVKPDFAAPGVEVKSSVPGGEWETYSGTSMAAPHIAGTIALMLHPRLSIGEVYDKLKESAEYSEAGDDLGEEKNTRYGHGIINAEEAVEYYLTVNEPENITNVNATLKGELTQMPGDEAEVFFRYRRQSEDKWSETNSKTLYEPTKFETKLEGLEKGTTYEYQAVGEWTDKQNITFIESFTTHRDVEIFTLSEQDLSLDNVTLRGEITDLYLDEVEVSFEYREVGGEWTEIEVGNISKSRSFSAELEGLENLTSYDFKAVGESEGEVFTGGVIGFTTPAPEPEWSDDERAYLISNMPELQWMRNDLENDYILVEDIDASRTADLYHGKGFEPIGNKEDPFLGTLEGRGHVIENLYINRPWTEYVGLFGYARSDIRDVNIIGGDMTGGQYIGGFVGLLTGPGDLTRRGELKNSYFEGNVSGEDSVGGLVGLNSGGVVNSSADGNVTGTSRVGGLLGTVGTGDSGELKSSYFDGQMIGEKDVGGLLGYRRDYIIENSHYNIDEVLINGEHRVTHGGLFDEQYRDWIENKELDIEDYNDSLVPVGDQYEISDVQGICDLLGFADNEEYKFRLSDDIDLSDEPGLHIPYIKADFDGDGHTISNLYIDMPFCSDIGMFGYANSAQITNISVIKVEVSGNRYVGGLVGFNDEGTISDSDAIGDVTGESHVGGLLGWNLYGIVNDSSATGDVSGDSSVGALVGSNYGSIDNSNTTGDVRGDVYVGGLVGHNAASIIASYTTGNVSGGLFIGGLVGRNSGSVTDTYSTGDVTGGVYVGGLVGRSIGSITDSYATGNVISEGTVVPLAGRDRCIRTYPHDTLISSLSEAAVGGLVGLNQGPVSDSYAMGNVTGESHVGGLVGYTSALVSDSFSTGNVTGESHVGGLVSGSRRGFTNVENSHYNIDEVLINGGHRVTLGGLFDEQYHDWIEDKKMYIEHYSDSLVPVGDQYEIRGVQGIRDLLGFADNEEYKFRLSDDIDLSDEPGLHIPYIKADFDGNNHTISNLTLERSSNDVVGFFGYNHKAILKNLALQNSEVKGENYVGALVGFNGDGKVLNSHSTGDVKGEEQVGGLVGWNLRGTVEKSSTEGEVSGDNYIGGLVGYDWGELVNSYSKTNVSGGDYVGNLIGFNFFGSVNHSFATGNVNGDDNIGGLVGFNFQGLVNHSYASGDVSGDNNIGGLVGWNIWAVNNSYSIGDVYGNRSTGGLVGKIGHSFFGYDSIVNHSYSVGEILSEDKNSLGGLIGSLESGNVTESYWDKEKSKVDISDGGIGLTTNEMRGKEAENNMKGFNFQDIWEIVNEDDEDAIKDGYPILQTVERKTQLSVQEVLQLWKLKINEPVGEGTVKVNGEVITEWPYEEFYGHDTEVELTSRPATGWRFKKWTVDIPQNKTDPEITITMDRNVEITVVFEQEDKNILDRILDCIEIPDRPEVPDRKEIPGFTSTLLLFAAFIAVVIYRKKGQR
ncbi:MAG: GLUG motif-containing protein [Candidatus Natronoplasma sp.]